MATVLIVSDNLASELFVPIAEDGHRVIESSAGGDPLQDVMRGEPDVIIMPDQAESVDGTELLPAVRSLSGAIVVVVGTGGTSRPTHALFEGADAYLQHPMEGDQLRSRLHSLLRRSHANSRTNGFLSSR